MATLSALSHLGNSILADLGEAKDAVATKVRRYRAERVITAQFKELLREHPASVAQAFATLAEAETAAQAKPKRARKAKAE